jgi:hypothetical protein
MRRGDRGEYRQAADAVAAITVLVERNPPDRQQHEKIPDFLVYPTGFRFQGVRPRGLGGDRQDRARTSIFLQMAAAWLEVAQQREAD